MTRGEACDHFIKSCFGKLASLRNILKQMNIYRHVKRENDFLAPKIPHDLAE